MSSFDDELYHYGVLGMKWGVRRTPEELGHRTNSKKQKLDKKIKAKTAKINQRGETIMAKRAKHRTKLEARHNKKISALQKDIDSFDSIKNGLKNKKGQTVMSKNDVAQIVDGLQKRMDTLNKKKSEKLIDYDLGTEMISDGYKTYKKVLSDYKNVKMKSFEDTAYKKSPEYKTAIKKYVNQVMSDVMYGVDYTALVYAVDSDAAKDYRKSR